MNQRPGVAGLGEHRAFLRPGGFSAHTGEVLGEGARLRSLLGVFSADLMRSTGRKLALAAALLPGFAVAIYVLGRTWLGEQASGGNVSINGNRGLADVIGVAAADHASFAVTNLGIMYAFLAGWLLLFQVGFVAPSIAHDTRAGALLLYFSRPVRRRHYLLARLGAATLVGGLGLCVPGWIALAAHAVSLSWTPGGTSMPGAAWAAWPLLGLGLALASALVALLCSVVALACGAVLRTPSAAGLIFGGALLGSVGGSWVAQLAWGRNSLARAADLHHALSAPMRLCLMGWDGADVPDFALLQAAASVGIWVVLAIVCWLALSRFMADPPLGRGRS